VTWALKFASVPHLKGVSAFACDVQGSVTFRAEMAGR
jgi:hypothetical protein